MRDPFMTAEPFLRSAPPTWSAYDADFTEEYPCAFGCGEMLPMRNATCDDCAIRNAQECGDWDEQSIRAAKRNNIPIPE
jgi:TfoX/Sxy family transcriptional regulator of competence genes